MLFSTWLMGVVCRGCPEADQSMLPFGAASSLTLRARAETWIMRVWRPAVSLMLENAFNMDIVIERFDASELMGVERK